MGTKASPFTMACLHDSSIPPLGISPSSQFLNPEPSDASPLSNGSTHDLAPNFATSEADGGKNEVSEQLDLGEINQEDSVQPIYPLSIPSRVTGATQKIVTGCGSLYLTINCDPATNHPIQVIGKLGKAGGCQADQIASIGQLMTIGLRYGAPIQFLAKTLLGMRCPEPRWNDGVQVLSCADGIAKGVRRWLSEMGMTEEADVIQSTNRNKV